MKILFYYTKTPHHKNIEGLKLMFDDLLISNKINDIKKFNYNLIIINDTFLKINFPQTIKVIYGPQCFVFPDKKISNINYNSLSSWNKEIMENINNKNKYFTLPFAININKFKPLQFPIFKFDCIVYYKNRNPNILKNILNKLKCNYKIFEYGKYNEEDYLYTLQHSKFMIVIDAHESQGFALQEAMSSGLPLLVLDIDTMNDEWNSNHPKYKSTSVPYFDSSCGIILKPSEYNLFEIKYNFMINNFHFFNPRLYIENNLSPEICKKRFYNFILNNENTQ